MKKLIITVIIAILSFSLWSEFVSIEKAKKVAINWLEFVAGEQSSKVEIVNEFAEVYNEKVCFYSFQAKENGFVLVAADDNVYPVLGYSSVSKIKKKITNPAVKDFLDLYKQQIDAVISENRNYPENRVLWNEILQKDFHSFPQTRDVSPLISANWNQDYPWNLQCPYDAAGPGNHVYAGCVAVAMAQIMKYWEYPTEETGSHTYSHPNYGVLSATFGNYNFSLMQNNYATNASEELLFHCGVAVEMDYGPEGSGASETDAKYAFENFFAFSNTIDLIYKNNYGQSEWEAMLREELDNGRPIFYTGSDSQFGHAFNCDGYQGTSYFHFNWGWSGWYNGYYYLNNLNPSGYDLTSNQCAIIGIQPPVIPDSPQNLSAQLIGSDVLLLWEAPNGANDEIIGYYIYRNNEQIYYAEGLASTSYFDMGLEEGTYYYYVTSFNGEMESEPSNNASVTIGSEAEENVVSQNKTVILQNSPNPFTSFTTISFYGNKNESNSLSSTKSNLEIYNVKGEKIRTLPIVLNGNKGSVIWNGKNNKGKKVTSGIYFYKLADDDSKKLKKMILMRD